MGRPTDVEAGLGGRELLVPVPPAGKHHAETNPASRPSLGGRTRHAHRGMRCRNGPSSLGRQEGWRYPARPWLPLPVLRAQAWSLRVGLRKISQ